MSIENLKTFDPFADADEHNDGEEKATTSEKIHIRWQQRNGRKSLTTIAGIPPKYDLKKITRIIKKQFHGGGTIIDDPIHGKVIQIQGDHRTALRDFLIRPESKDDKLTGMGFDKEMIKVHGF